MMKRSTAREIAMQLNFEAALRMKPASEVLADFFDEDYYLTLKKEDELYSEFPDEKQLGYITRLVSGVTEHGTELDHYIEKYAKDWSVARISRVAAAIMRIAMYEILYMPEIPNGVAVNEAVELAKDYEEWETVSFINGVLGTFIKKELTTDE